MMESKAITSDDIPAEVDFSNGIRGKYTTQKEHLAIVHERMRQYENGELSTRPADEVIQEVKEKHGL